MSHGGVGEHTWNVSNRGHCRKLWDPPFQLNTISFNPWTHFEQGDFTDVYGSMLDVLLLLLVPQFLFKYHSHKLTAELC